MAAGKVHSWPNSVGITFALHKGESMVVSNTRLYNEINISIGGHPVA